MTRRHSKIARRILKAQALAMILSMGGIAISNVPFFIFQRGFYDVGQREVHIRARQNCVPRFHSSCATRRRVAETLIAGCYTQLTNAFAAFSDSSIKRYQRGRKVLSRSFSVMLS